MTPWCDMVNNMPRVERTSRRARRNGRPVQTSLTPRSSPANRNPLRSVQHLSSLADLSIDDQASILRLLDKDSQIRELKTLLSKTQTELQEVDQNDINAISRCKTKAAGIQKIITRLRVTDLRLDALELTRRAERKLGIGIREGQSRGEIMTKQRPDTAIYSPKDFSDEPFGNGGIYSLVDGVTDKNFEEALAEGKAEKKLSRANIAAKCQAKREDVVEVNEMAVLTNAMPERFRALVLLMFWCGMTFPEVSELRRGDIDLDGAEIRVRRTVSRSGAVVTLKPTGRVPPRDEQLPQPLIPVFKEHLSRYVDPDPDALLCPANHGGHLAVSTFQHYFYRARDAVGHPGLQLADLRRLGATATTAGLAELVPKLTDSPPPKRIRKTAAGRNVMKDLFVTMSSLAMVVDDTDPEEVEFANHREEVVDIFESMTAVRKFLNKVKEQG